MNTSVAVRAVSLAVMALPLIVLAVTALIVALFSLLPAPAMRRHVQILFPQLMASIAASRR